MPQPKLRRPFQERFLDNYDRAQLRREVQAVPSRRFSEMRKKYTTWALGASLAIGGIGTPLAMIPRKDAGANQKTLASTVLDSSLDQDLQAARSIAQQVAQGVESAATSPLDVISEAPRKLTLVTEKVREEFFKQEVPFGEMIYKEAKKNDLRPELVAAVVQAESRFKPTARSGAGAVGLMQLVPRTGRWMGARDLTNPAQNIAAGTKYLKYLNERFDGNETNVIAAYNAGEGNVKRFGGIPPFRETRSYVKKVRDYEQDFRNRVDNHVAGASSGDLTEAGEVVAR
ncbi:MAG: lytic transglycosylase domain-containing protein [Acidobacteriota bacterium]|nr:lytic transglycosylase domain-containing protein [Acidobacteriota bacterium]